MILPHLTWHTWQADESTRGRVRRAYDGTPLKGLPASAASQLAGSTVAVFGLGAVGGAVFEQLARAGVGTLLGVDPDTYGRESPLTQPISWEPIGEPKALVQGARAHAANPAAAVRTAIGQAQDVPLSTLRQAHVLVATGDNLDLTLWAGRMAAALGKPLVNGAVHGETWTAIVRAYDLNAADAACPGCGLGQAEYAAMKSRQGCDPGTIRPQDEPTRAPPVVCSLAAQLAVCEVLKRLTGLERGALSGEEYAHSLLSHRAWRTTLPRCDACRQPHERWTQVDVARDWANSTLGELAAEIGVNEYAPLLQVRGETPWIGFALCASCGKQQTVRRFARLGQDVGNCACGAGLTAGPLGMRSLIPTADLRAVWDAPLDALGVEDGAAIGMAPEEAWTWFFVAGIESIGRPMAEQGAAT